MYFYKLDKVKENPIFQADIGSDIENPIWTAKVDKDWLEYFDADFLDSWLNDFGSQVNRSKHKTIQIDFGSSYLQFKHYGENGNFSHDSSKLELDVAKASAKTLKCIYLSKDIIPILYSLTTSEIIGKIDISAHNTYLYITYKTQLGLYKIYIPTCSKNGKRVTTAFERYGA